MRFVVGEFPRLEDCRIADRSEQRSSTVHESRANWEVQKYVRSDPLIPLDYLSREWKISYVGGCLTRLVRLLLHLHLVVLHSDSFGGFFGGHYRQSANCAKCRQM